MQVRTVASNRQHFAYCRSVVHYVVAKVCVTADRSPGDLAAGGVEVTIERDAIWHAVYAAAYVKRLGEHVGGRCTYSGDFDPNAHEKYCVNSHYDAECCADDNAETRSKVAHDDAARKAGKP